MTPADIDRVFGRGRLRMRSSLPGMGRISTLSTCWSGCTSTVRAWSGLRVSFEKVGR